jgi:GAF domain-containing protein
MHTAPTAIPPDATREERYAHVAREAAALIPSAPDAVAAMANLAALLHAAFHWHWTGFYRVVGDTLLLGPFQGPVACDRIAHGKGVCGSAWAQRRTLVVPDVDLFPGHIACSALSRSEIVVPVRDPGGRVVAVLDIDSVVPADFGPTDASALEALVRELEPHWA